MRDASNIVLRNEIENSTKVKRSAPSYKVTIGGVCALREIPISITRIHIHTHKYITFF